MPRLSFLNFQYNLSKSFPPKPVKWLSIKDRQISGLIPAFQPENAEMKRVFDKIDSDGDGKISSDELRVLLEAMGIEKVETEVKEMMWAADLDRDSFINFRDFMGIHKRGVTTSDIQRAFWAFDANGDGRIGAGEVMAVMNKIGESCSFEECRKMVRQVDKSGNGLVDMDDFMIMMTRTMKPL